MIRRIAKEATPLLAGFMIALLSAVPLGAGDAGVLKTEKGHPVNLATIRGVKASASKNLQNQASARYILHGNYGEIRFSKNQGQSWWMMELPQEYRVSGIRLHFRNVIRTLELAVKVSSVPLGDDEWAGVEPVAVSNGPLGWKDGIRVATCEFDPVAARFVRVEFGKHNHGPEGEAVNHPDLVIHKVQVWGPDRLAINSTLSVAQAWAGGRCTISDAGSDSVRSGYLLIDENHPDAHRFGKDHTRFLAPGGSSEGTVGAGSPPCQVVVTLQHPTQVEAVAYSAITRIREDRPRDIAIYTSPHRIGDQWVLQKKVKDIQGGEYEEFSFDAPVQAVRVRFDIERVWNRKLDSKTKLSFGHLGEVYVFGETVSPDFTFTLENKASTNGAIYDANGKRIRTLWKLRRFEAGVHQVSWDGLNDAAEAVPAGAYEYRVLVNQATYKTVGVIGNNATPNTEKNHNPPGLLSIAVDAEGHVYTANDWVEAGQDFRKWHREDGRNILDPKYGVRKHKPGGGAHAIAVDDKYIYCAVHSWPRGMAKPKELIERFRMNNAEYVGFPSRKSTNGHIELYDNPRSQVPENTPQTEAGLMGTKPCRSLAVSGETLFASDALAGKVLRFDRESGQSNGAIDVPLPHALAIDAAGMLWVGHEHGKVSAFTQDGTKSWSVLTDLGHIQAMAFGPDNKLFIADRDADQVRIYQADIDNKTATFLTTFGSKAKAGDYKPDQFYELLALAIDKNGYLSVSQRFPTDGARLTRFDSTGKVVWDQFSLEHCTTGNYMASRPDEVISTRFHRYELIDKEKGTWAFRGNMLATDPKYIFHNHGTMTRLERNGTELLFQAYGDSLQVYRRDEEGYHLASMIGCREPYPDGEFFYRLPESKRGPAGFWSWHDTNKNGSIDKEEIDWFKEPTQGDSWPHRGINTDAQGNAIYCSLAGKAVREIPLIGYDEHGNPIYDIGATRPLRAVDDPNKTIVTTPYMAKRADDGSLYVMGKSNKYPIPPEAHFGWMAGWALARYDKDGNRLWATRLPEACPGMDVIPDGGGVVLASVKSPKIFHYTADGFLAGAATPGDAAGDRAGIADNVASIQVNRDPRDGVLDVFVEDCLFHRFLWYRIDDQNKINSITGKLIRE